MTEWGTLGENRDLGNVILEDYALEKCIALETTFPESKQNNGRLGGRK